MTHDDDDAKNDRPKLYIGDIGTILLAGVFFVGMLFMIFSPSPFEGVFKKQPEAKADNGEVTITLPAKD
jgi:hypothetical protein